VPLEPLLPSLEPQVAQPLARHKAAFVSSAVSLTLRRIAQDETCQHAFYRDVKAS
jgi:hypothetical protein